VDVEGVVQVDVDAVVQRIDVNAPLSGYFDALLSRIDLNEQMERIDMDAVMNRVLDFDTIIRRSNLTPLLRAPPPAFVCSGPSSDRSGTGGPTLSTSR
jgi:hypothetical protein